MTTLAQTCWDDWMPFADVPEETRPYFEDWTSEQDMLDDLERWLDAWVAERLAEPEGSE